MLVRRAPGVPGAGISCMRVLCENRFGLLDVVAPGFYGVGMRCWLAKRPVHGRFPGRFPVMRGGHGGEYRSVTCYGGRPPGFLRGVPSQWSWLANG